MEQFELSYLELDLIGQSRELDVRRNPFSFPHTGSTWDERLELAGQVEEALARRGLVYRDRLAPHVERAVELFAGGEPAVTVQGLGPLGNIMGRGAVGRGEAVLGTEQETGLLFTFGSQEELVRWLLSMLPDHHKARGSSATITADAPARAQRAPDDFSGVSYLSGGDTSYRERDQQAVADIRNRKRLGAGIFEVLTLDRIGHPGLKRSLEWIDLDIGRYAGFSTFDQDGRESRVYTPADFKLLWQKLNEMFQACMESLR